MSWVAVAVAGASLVGTVVASSSAKSAAKKQAGAIQDSSEANIALAREQRAQNEALFAQYLGDENMAKAYMDALLYGEGSYTPGGGVPGGQQDEGVGRLQLDPILREQNPDLAALWDSWERAGNSQTNGHRTLYGDFVGYVQHARGQAVQQGIATLQQQQAAQGGQTGATTITRDQVLALIEGTPLSQMAEEFFAGREGLADETLADADALALEERGDLEGVRDDSYARFRDRALEGRTGLRGTADEVRDARLAQNAEQKSAYDAKAALARDRAVNLAFSRGGVTGQTGQTTRNVAEAEQDYALDASMFFTGIDGQVYDQWGNRVWDAERNYQSGLDDAEGYYANMSGAAAENYGNRRFANQNRYAATRAANYDQYSGDRINSYADYADNLRSRADRGYDARSAIASGGQNFVNTATRENSRAGEAAAAAYGRQGQINQQLYGDLASIGGNLFGSMIKPKNPAGSSDVERDEYGWPT